MLIEHLFIYSVSFSMVSVQILPIFLLSPLFFFKVPYICSLVWAYCNLFTWSSAGGNWSCFLCSGIKNNVTMNALMETSFQSCAAVSVNFRSGFARVYEEGPCTGNITRYCQN